MEDSLVPTEDSDNKVSVGPFGLDKTTLTISGPRKYMEERGSKFVEAVLSCDGGEEFRFALHLRQSIPDPYQCLLGALFLDWIGWSSGATVVVKDDAPRDVMADDAFWKKARQV